ncbi:MAG: cell division protein FtsL [Pseudomonadota bacterium]
MHNKAVWGLTLAVFITALSVVKVRHEHRLAYVEFQAAQQNNDALVDEWSQLLTEENLWSFPHRIEKDAQSQLSMRKPEPDEMKYVDLSEESLRLDSATAARASQ